MKTRFLAIVFLGLVSSRITYAQVDGVFGLTPAGPSLHLAVEIDVTGGAGVHGLEWFHNDASSAFEVILVEGVAGVAPDLSAQGLTLQALTNISLGWGSVDFPVAVTSSTGTMFAVFRFPSGLERTGDGLNGGPGMGYYVGSEGLRAFVTHDGSTWDGLKGGLTMAVRALPATSKAAVVELASLAVPHDEKPALVELTELTFLSAPHPNPFNPRVELPFTMASGGHVTMRVVDLRGRVVRELANRVFSAGRHRLKWDGVDHRGRPVSSGAYYVRFEAHGESKQRSVVLVR